MSEGVNTKSLCCTVSTSTVLWLPCSSFGLQKWLQIVEMKSARYGATQNKEMFMAQGSYHPSVRGMITDDVAGKVQRTANTNHCSAVDLAD